jgi:hypothetical protein
MKQIASRCAKCDLVFIYIGPPYRQVCNSCIIVGPRFPKMLPDEKHKYDASSMHPTTKRYSRLSIVRHDVKQRTVDPERYQ